MRKSIGTKIIVINDNTISVKLTDRNVDTILPALKKLKSLSTDVIVLNKNIQGSTFFVAGNKLLNLDKEIFKNFDECFLPEELAEAFMERKEFSSKELKYFYPTLPKNKEEQISYILLTLQDLFDKNRVDYEKINPEDEDYNSINEYSSEKLFQTSIENYLHRLIFDADELYENPKYVYLLNSILNNFLDKNEFNTFIEENFKDDLEDYNDNYGSPTDMYDFGPWTR